MNMQNKNIETPQELYIPTWVTKMGSEHWSKLNKNAPASYVSKIKNAMNDSLSFGGWNRIGSMVSRYVPEAVFADPIYDNHIKAWRKHMKTVKAKASKPHAKKSQFKGQKNKARTSSATNLFNQASRSRVQPAAKTVKPKRTPVPLARRKRQVAQ